MPHVTFNITMDEKLKKQFEEICCNCGMSISTVINAFASFAVQEGRIPLGLKKSITREGALEAIKTIRKKAVLDGISDMSLDEINSEINKVRNGK